MDSTQAAVGEGTQPSTQPRHSTQAPTQAGKGTQGPGAQGDEEEEDMDDAPKPAVARWGPKHIQAKQIDPAPSQAKQIDPTPRQAKQMDPAPSQAKQMDPAPSQAKQMDPAQSLMALVSAIDKNSLLSKRKNLVLT
eukprot:gene15145-21207_t